MNVTLEDTVDVDVPLAKPVLASPAPRWIVERDLCAVEGCAGPIERCIGFVDRDNFVHFSVSPQPWYHRHTCLSECETGTR